MKIFLPHELTFRLAVSLIVSVRLSTGIRISFDIQGDIPIAALFDVHEYDDVLEGCGKIKPQTGIIYIEAFLFAVDQINANNSTFLYGNKLSARVFDSCSNEKRLKRNLRYAVEYKTQGIIGPQYSKDAMISSVALDIFERTLISYSATDPDLDDSKKYSNFHRTIPSYYGQVEVMIDLALYFKWTYVSFVYTSGTREKAASLFQKKASSVDICVPKILSISKDSSDDDIIRALKSVLKQQRIKVLFIFLDEHNLKRLLTAAKIMKNETQNLTFVGSDSWGGKYSILTEMKDIVRGSLTIQYHVKRVHKFENYFTSLNPHNNKRNIWFKKFWEDVFNCSLKNNSDAINVCSGSESIKHGLRYYNTTPVMTVINAVYSYAHVFKKLINERCISRQISGIKCVKNSHLLSGEINLRDIRDMLKTIKFQEPFGKGSFSFKEFQAFSEEYDILNVKLNNQSFDYYYEKVGIWRKHAAANQTIESSLDNKTKQVSSSLLELQGNVEWKNGLYHPPKSTCSDKCPRGLYQLFQDSTKCCWQCQKCGFNEYVANNTCIACELEYAPDMHLERCVALPLRYLVVKNGLPSSILGISGIGVVLTIITMAIFLKNFNNKIIKASGRELCLNILAGIMMTYVSPVIFLLEPSSTVCFVQKIIVSFALTLSFGPLALKLNRIYRIFQCAKKMTVRPIMASLKSQMLISLAISLVCLLLSVATTKDYPSKISKRYPDHRQYVIKHCVLNPSTFAINLCYSSVLMILSTWYAFKTRKFPENFNETRLIGFTMYTNCLVLSSCLPPFFIMGQNNDNQVLILCFMCESIATINLFGLFCSKLFKLLQQKRSNLDASTNNRSSSTFEFTMQNSIHMSTSSM